MISSQKLIKRIFCIASLLLALVFFSAILPPKVYVSHAFIGQKKSQIVLENNSFERHKYDHKKNMPYEITEGWTFNGVGTVEYGAVSVKEDDYKDFGLDENPERSDRVANDKDYLILMFRSSPKEGARADATSKEKKFKKASFYKVSFFVKTVDALGSAYLLAGDKQVQLINIHSLDWKTYSFFVATDNFKEVSFRLSLCFGGGKNAKANGIVFFDEVSVYDITDRDFNEAKAQSLAQSLDNVLDLRLPERKTDFNFKNADFESNLTPDEWVRDEGTLGKEAQILVETPNSLKSIIQEKFDTEGKNITLDTNVYNSTKSLLIMNVSKTHSSLSSGSDNELLIPQHGQYRMSLRYKTGNISDNSGFEVSLIPINPKLTKATQSKLTSSSEDNIYNGFSTAEFYIQGNTRKDEKIKISLGLGNSDSECSGWVVIDDICFESITNDEFKDQSSSSKTLDMTKNALSTKEITNGAFEKIENPNLTISYPLKPANWTYTGDASGAESGVIRINPEHFRIDSRNFGSPENPGLNTANPDYAHLYSVDNFNKNVLMVHSILGTDVFFTSEKKTISANTDEVNIAKFCIGINTQDDVKAFMRLVNSKKEVVAIIDNIDTKNTWQMYSIFIKNGASELSVSLEVGTSGKGFAFFDSAEYFGGMKDEPGIEPNSTYLNLLDNNFTVHSSIPIYEDGTWIYNHSGFKNFDSVIPRETGLTGIISATKEHIPLWEGAEDEGIDYIFEIHNKEMGYQHMSNVPTYDFKKDKYYEITVYIKTDLDPELLKKKPFGALFEIIESPGKGDKKIDRSSNTNRFKNIVTDDADNNGWAKYSIYFACEKDQTMEVILGLGTGENMAQGTAYFGRLTVNEVNVQTYTSQKAGEKTLVSKTDVKPEEPEKDEDKDNKDQTKPASSNMNMWAIASSMLLAVALIFSIAGYLIRRIPKLKKKKYVVKKPKNIVYAKPRTDIDIKGIRDEVDNKARVDINELKLKLEKLSNEEKKLKDTYEKTPSMQESKTSDNKSYIAYVKKMNKLQGEFDYLSSALAYIKNASNRKSMQNRVIRTKRAEAKKYFEKINEMKDEKKKEADKNLHKHHKSKKHNRQNV